MTASKRSASETVDTGFGLRYYVVAYLDVLGQRQKIRELRRLPQNPEEERATLGILRDTAGFILHLRTLFDRFFRGVAEPTGILDDLTGDQRRWAEECRRGLASHRGVSDSIMITVPLMNENDHCNSLASVFSTLFATAGIFTASLAQHHAIRGGIDVGVGIEIHPGEVYGAALVRAYDLESTAAVWPRVLIGDELWQYLLSVDGLPDTRTGRLARQLAATSQALITTAEDGCRMLDFLGPGMRANTDGLPTEVIREAYDFVVAEESRFQGDETLGSRYAALRRYI